MCRSHEGCEGCAEVRALPSEAAEVLSVESKTEVSLGAVLDALETIDGALTARHRAELVSMAARSQAPLALDADEGTITYDVPADALDPEAALRETNRKFVRRFQYIEQHAERDIKEMTLQEMDALWDEAKTSG